MTGAPANGKPSAAPRDETLDRIADMATDLKDLARVRMELVAEQVRDATVHGRRAMWLALVAAALLRVGAEAAADPTPWIALSGVIWSGGWLAFLSVHLPALARPAPFPVLSAARRFTP